MCRVFCTIVLHFTVIDEEGEGEVLTESRIDSDGNRGKSPEARANEEEHKMAVVQLEMQNLKVNGYIYVTVLALIIRTAKNN